MNARQQVFFDCNIIDLLAGLGADPVGDLRDCEFQIVCTPDLRQEYQLASEKSASDATRRLALSLVDVAKRSGILGFDGGPFAGLDEGSFASSEQMNVLASIPLKERPGKIPGNRTDSHLVALAEFALA